MSLEKRACAKIRACLVDEVMPVGGLTIGIQERLSMKEEEDQFLAEISSEI